MFVCKYVWLSMKKFILKGINIETMHLRMVHYYVHMRISGIELSRRRFTLFGCLYLCESYYLFHCCLSILTRVD